MAARKRVRKSTAKVGKLIGGGVIVPQAHGGALKRGGTHPRAGRPPAQWRETLRALVSNDAVLAHIRKVLKKGPKDPQFFRALDYATDHGYGKAQSNVDVTSNGQTLSTLLAQAFAAAPDEIVPEGTPGDDPQ